MNDSPAATISPQEALKKYTSRQLRFAFLIHQWHATLDYRLHNYIRADVLSNNVAGALAQPLFRFSLI